MQIHRITLVHSGPAPFCEWCGRLKTPGSTHGEIEATDPSVAKVTCIVIVSSNGDLKGN